MPFSSRKVPGSPTPPPAADVSVDRFRAVCSAGNHGNAGARAEGDRAPGVCAQAAEAAGGARDGRVAFAPGGIAFATRACNRPRSAGLRPEAQRLGDGLRGPDFGRSRGGG
jgi:hypothetical protein